jgi:hypothetical protein
VAEIYFSDCELDAKQAAGTDTALQGRITTVVLLLIELRLDDTYLDNVRKLFPHA